VDVSPTHDWMRPALDTRRPLDPQSVTGDEETTESRMHAASETVPILIHERRWLRETLKIAAAAIVFTIVGALLALVLHDNDSDSNVAMPTPAVAPTVTPPTTPSATATTQSPSPTPTMPSVGLVAATIPVGQQPSTITSGAGSIWVTNSADGTVSRIDPLTNSVVATIRIAEPGELSAEAIAADDTAVWAGAEYGTQIVRIDPATNEVVATIPLDSRIRYVIRIGHGAVWAESWFGNRVLRIDPATNTVVASIPVAAPHDIAFTTDAVWVAHSPTDGGSELVKIDPATNTVVATVTIAEQRAAVLVAIDELLWVATSRVLVQIEASTTEFLSSTPLPDALRFDPFSPGAMIGNGKIWAFQNGVLWQLDLTTLDWTGAMTTPPYTWATYFGESIWGSTDDNTVVRIDLDD
jgi:virginiamycin B lyase